MANAPIAPVAVLGTAPTPEVWKHIPVMDILANPNKGFGGFDHFMGGVSSSAGTTLNTKAFGQMIVTHVLHTGTVTDAEETLGAVLFTAAGAENDGVEAQTHEIWYPARGRRIAFGGRLKTSSATANDVYLGLCTKDVDVCGSIPNDRIGFNVADGSANIMLKCAMDNTGADEGDSGDDIVAATYIRLEALVDELSKVRFYVDGVLTDEYDSNIPSDEALSFTFGHQAGATAATTSIWDWVYCYQWDLL
jgi:hypothetical protein